MTTLVVQMGHCYRTTGATGVAATEDHVSEQAFATSVANECYRLLNGKQGWTVKRVLADISNYAGDAFAAIHCDGNNNPDVNGASVGYQNAAGRDFARAFKTAYVAEGWTGSFRADNYTTNLAQYYGVHDAIVDGNTRAMIVECGFLTSPDDYARMSATRVARAIGMALGIQLEGQVMDWNAFWMFMVSHQWSAADVEEHNLVGLPANLKETHEAAKWFTTFCARQGWLLDEAKKQTAEAVKQTALLTELRDSLINPGV